ncbi:hypothetical protein Tco_0597330 [Tanacetum coccineum]
MSGVSFCWLFGEGWAEECGGLVGSSKWIGVVAGYEKVSNLLTAKDLRSDEACRLDLEKKQFCHISSDSILILLVAKHLQRIF